MKARIFQQWSLALLLAVIPILAGCDQQQANSAPVSDVAASEPAASPANDTNVVDDANAAGDTAAVTDTNQPDGAGMTDDQLANAPGEVISTPETGSTNTSNNPELSDLTKLVQAGMGEGILLAYVTNSPTPFNLSSDDILYLNDLGTPETVVQAMLQRDQYFKSIGSAGVAPAQPTQPAYANNAPAAPESYPDQNAVAQATAATPPLTPPPAVVEDAEQSPNASYSYFYDSLSPYGSWINIDGYGPCWQPTAVVANPGWQPYCDHGSWSYTDCGWCWVSDYSWGWAPFHYGRWFHHNRWGWCWAPDTVWGPAWVSWRYGDAYCGWAPLPPAACYRPGFGFTYFGRSVGFGFGFGLTASSYLFVSLDHFHDRSPGRFRVPHREIGRVWGATAVHNQMIRGNNNLLINRGVPVSRVATASHTEIRPIHVRVNDAGPRSAGLGHDGRSLDVYRPNLPAPTRGNNNPRLAGEGVAPAPHFDLRTRTERPVTRPTMARPTVNPSMPGRAPIISNPAGVRPGENQVGGNRFPPSVNQRPPNSLILRGPDRGTLGGQQNPIQNQSPALRHGPVFQPQAPVQPYAPAQPSRALPPPTFNRPGFGQPGNGADLQQRQQNWPQQQTPSQELRTPRMNDQNANSGFRSEPIQRQPIPEQPRNFEQPRSFEQPRNNFEQPRNIEPRSAPMQPAAPAFRQDNGGSGFRGGGGGGNANIGGGGGGNRGGGGGGGGNNNGGGGGGGRNR